MMKKNVLIIVLSLIVSNLLGQQGKVLESLKFESQKVDYPLEYSIYLPPGYDSSERSYPVLYLLHGYSDDETGWIQFGEANSIADNGIKSGDATPMIIVMPDGKVTWYSNSPTNNDMWQDMFIDEFIPFIEKEYRIREDRQFRAIAGLSMGGFGALQISMRHTDLFSSCVAFSSGTITDDQIISDMDNKFTHYFGNLYGNGLKGKDLINDEWKAYNPIHLVQNTPKEKLKKVRFYIDCGDDDFLYKGNSTLHILMRDLGIPHEYRVRNGGHSWEYWRTGLPEGLKFISKTFHR